MSIAQEAWKILNSARKILDKHYPGIGFPLDGRLVGDVGEAVLLSLGCFEKLPAGTALHDLQYSRDGMDVKVQVKTTQKSSANRTIIVDDWDHLIFLQLDEIGHVEVLFDGPGDFIRKNYDNHHQMTMRQMERISADERFPGGILTESDIEALRSL